MNFPFIPPSLPKVLRISFRLLLVGAVLWVINTIWYKPFNINHFFERVLLEYAVSKPEDLSRYKALDPYLSFYNGQLNPAKAENYTDLLVKNMNLLTSYKRNELKPEEKLSYEILQRIIEGMLMEDVFAGHDYPINQQSGVHIDFPYFMITYHEIKDVEDAEQYIERLSVFDQKAQAVLLELQNRQQANYLPPKYVAEKVLEQIDKIRSKDPRKNILYLDFVEKTDSLENLNTLVRGELHYSCKKMIEDVVYPSLQKLSAHFEEVLANYPEDIHGEGVWRFPDGEEYYKSLLLRYTSADESDLYGEEMKQSALSEFRRRSAKLQNYIDSVMAPGLGLSSAEFLEELYRKPAYSYTNTENGRTAYLDALKRYSESANKKSIELFGSGPKAGPFIGRMLAFRENYGSHSEYQSSDLYNKRRAKYLLNLKDMSMYREFMIPTECVSELFPGRHYFSFMQKRLDNVPSFRKIVSFPSYSEGWKMYSLQIGEENNFFSDPLSFLGKLHYEQLQAGLLVTDNSIHFGHWDREEAIGFLTKKIGIPEVYAEQLTDDIVLNPGKVWAGKYGLSHFLRLRKLAESKLGKKFDYTDYHRFLIGKGPMPFDILEKQVNLYIEQKLKTGAKAG